MAAGRRLGWSVEITLTIALLMLGRYGTGPAAQNQGVTAPPTAYVLVFAAALAVLAIRVRPLWTFIAANALLIVYLGLQYPYGPILLTTVVADVGLAVRAPLRRSLTAMGLALLATEGVLAVGVLTGDRSWRELVTIVPWVVVPAAVGIAIKARRDATSDVRSAHARQAVSEERLRLAQEVHDVAGHGFAVIAMQAGVALRVLDRDPVAARAALEGIRATSRQALESLRAEVEALGDSSPLRPATGLEDLAALAERVRGAGLPVTVDAAAGDLPTAVDHVAYRIVQESLTNVLRHGGADATAHVSLHRRDRVLEIEVSDTGRGGPLSEPAGRGIAGMRTRVAALGGTLEAGPAARGFLVRARLPLTGTQS
jgi:signal transduction histidine kinase